MIPDINLLPKVDRGQTSSKIISILIAILVLIILTFLLWQYFSAGSSLTVLKNEEQDLISQRDELQSELDVFNTENAIGSLEQSVEYVEHVSFAVSPIITEIESLQPGNSYLRSYEFSESSTTINIDFETLNDISDYVARLSKSDYFSDVQVNAISNFEIDLNTETNEEGETINFNEQQRYSANILLTIDETYLTTGGIE